MKIKAVSWAITLLLIAITPHSYSDTKASSGRVSGIPMEQLKAFAETYWQIKNSYVDQVDDKQLFEGAINGMLKSLDPYSGYLNEEDLKDLQVSSDGVYDGLGVEVVAEDEQVRVVSIIEDSPAARAGIKENDRIVAVDAHSLVDVGAESLIDSMRGVAGEPVVLKILHPESQLPVTYQLVRETLEVKSIRVAQMPQDIWHVTIKMFQRDTGYELEQLIRRATANKRVAGVIVDLRNNPGGVLTAAVDVADLMIASGIIVSTEGRTVDSYQKFFANPGDILEATPIVVLINGQSASASEIVAGALQDHKRGLIVGQQSYGKGVVQSIVPLKQNTAIKLTTSRYLTPTGRSIHGKGIAPDVELKQDATADNALPSLADKELQQAYDLLLNQVASGKVETKAQLTSTVK